jgi:membrane associated rhomboid family serine protease
MIPLKDNVPTRHLPILTLALIVANLAIFVWAEHAPAERLPTTLGVPLRVSGFTAVTAEFGFVPCEVQNRCAHGQDSVLLGYDNGRPVYARVHHVPVLASVFTAMFMHGSWDHILGNMLFLAIFGKNVEDAFGSLRYLLFYITGGFVAMMTQAALTLIAGTPADARAANLGASGAIAAVLGAFFVLYPGAKVTGLLGILPLRISAWFFLGAWFLYQFI